jgi:hypothetical protein
MSTRRLFAIVAALALGASSVAAQSPPPAADVAATVDSLARAWIADRGSPAVSVAVIRGIGFTEGTIILLYNQYDIASYAAGPIELEISREEAKPFLKVK